MILKVHKILRSHQFFLLFTWFTRVMLALAFLPSGYKKIMGMRFTQIPVEDPVGFFFEALYRTGIYWHFLGFIQILVAILLLIPRTTFLGAVLYFPVIINIFLIVVGMHFVGTPIIAGLMLLGNIYLFIWDFPRTQNLLKTLLKKP